MSKTLKLVATLRKGESYYKRNEETGISKPRHRYSVSGSPEALAEYKKLKEAEGWYREDENGTPLHNSGVKQNTINLEITDGVIYQRTQDDDVMALESAYHNETIPEVKAHLAMEIAKLKARKASSATGTTVNTSVSAEEAEEPASEEETNL